jgi:hypothetical protein
MRPLRLLSAFVLLGPLATVSCTSTSGRCEDLCQYIDDCGLDPAKDCKQSCEEKYDDASSKCQDAFDEYADCISDAATNARAPPQSS